VPFSTTDVLAAITGEKICMNRTFDSAGVNGHVYSNIHCVPFRL